MPDATETQDVPVQVVAEEAPPTDWAPQAFDEATGVYLTGDYPSNHRLRAEAIAKARRKTDPDGIVSEELIADTAARLRTEREAE